MRSPGCGSLESLTIAAERHRSGQSLQCAILTREGEPVGRCGLAPYPRLPGWVQTATYLAPAFWGGSTNRLVKRLLAEIAFALGHRQVILSVALDNPRSIAAARRLTSQPGELCYEPWYPRTARCFVMSRPNDAQLRLSADALRLLEAQPAYPYLLASPALSDQDRRVFCEVDGDRA